MPLVINKQTDHFFISINKIGKHSFIMLGVYDQNNAQHLLCRVGKIAFQDEDSEPCFGRNFLFDEAYICCLRMSFLFKVLFSSTQAILNDEGVSRRDKRSQPISYQAYDITYDQYLDFVQMLESLQTSKHKFECYKPKSNDGDNVTLELTNELIFSPQPLDKIKENVGELRIGNTCRHSAIALIEATLHASTPSLVSSNFMTDLPYKTALEYGRPSKNIPFYVLPVSPTAFPELDATKKKVITKLYERMEHLLLIKAQSNATQDKFLKLKELYLHILGPQKELSLEELLQSIRTWKNENKSTLGALRKTYFWDSFFTRQSATMNLISELEDDLKTVQAK